ncbi:13260_t:CDS:2 [Acaulospora morrowiae]|uniref:13260_t:CDS:1 n=1 Tax=Acaulospora morrowiae TaxID=94023 RepID=A0A9N9EGW5_9GLOM|nr:13260_t:CDS:2 [Acaulospora morrowiae]
MSQITSIYYNVFHFELQGLMRNGLFGGIRSVMVKIVKNSHNCGNDNCSAFMSFYIDPPIYMRTYPLYAQIDISMFRITLYYFTEKLFNPMEHILVVNYVSKFLI